MLTIHHLEVRFDVEGEGEEAAFVRLFEKHMKVWRRIEREQEQQHRMLQEERALGDAPGGKGGAC